MKKTLAYETDRIETVRPEDVEKIRNDNDKDEVTLLTCTPYGVNSHRLLVTGHRISDTAHDEVGYIYKIVLYISLLVLIGMVLAILIVRRRRSRSIV